MSEPVRVSVVMAVHDASGDAAAALQSVLASDLRALQVLIVDNSSAGHAEALVAGACDARVTAVRLRAGVGAARPRNVGIARAAAPYVALLEPEDLIRPDKLSAAVTALDRHPEAGFAFSDFGQLDASGGALGRAASATLPFFRTLPRTPLGDNWQLIAQPDLALGLLYENFIVTSAVVMRRGLITEIGPFNESTTYSGDLDLWFRLAHSCDALYWDQPGHVHRERPTSSGDEPASARALDTITVLRREKERWNERRARAQLNRRIAQSFAGLGHAERRRRNRLRSVAMFASAFAACPDVRWLRGMLGSGRSQPAVDDS